MKRFIQKLIGFSVGPFVGAMLSLITIPVTTYFVAPSEYGKASMFITFQMLVGTFLFLGMDQAYTRAYHEEKNKLNLFQNALCVPMLFAFLIIVLTTIFPHTVSTMLFDSPDEVIAALLFGVMIVFMVIERFILLSIRMEEKALEYSLLNIFVKFSILVLTVVYVLFIRRDFLAVVYSTVFGQILGDVYLLVRYRKLLNLRHFSIDRRLVRGLLAFGLPVAVAASLSSLLNYLDRIFLRVWSNYYQIGIFFAAFKVASALSIVQTSFTSFWVPTAYRWYAEKKEIGYFKMVSDAVLLGMSTLAMGILIFKNLITTILSSGYMDARFIIGLLCLHPIMYTISSTTTMGIDFSKKSYLNIWVSLSALIPNVVINVLFIPLFGAVGAAAASAVAYFFFFAARTFFSRRNGLRFPVGKHYTVLTLVMAAAFLNAFPVTGITWINCLLLLIVVALQWPTIRQMLKIYRRSRMRPTA